MFPLGLGIVLSSLYFRIDLFLVEYWHGTGEVATYNAVFRLVEALRLFPAAVLAVLLPIVFGCPTGGFMLRMSLGLAVFGVAISAVLYPLVPWLIETAYGPRYLGGVTPFRVLLVAFPLLSLNYGLTNAVIGWRGQRTRQPFRVADGPERADTPSIRQCSKWRNVGHDRHDPARERLNHGIAAAFVAATCHQHVGGAVVRRQIRIVPTPRWSRPAQPPLTVRRARPRPGPTRGARTERPRPQPG